MRQKNNFEVVRYIVWFHILFFIILVNIRNYCRIEDKVAFISVSLNRLNRNNLANDKHTRQCGAVSIRNPCCQSPAALPTSSVKQPVSCAAFPSFSFRHPDGQPPAGGDERQPVQFHWSTGHVIPTGCRVTRKRQTGLQTACISLLAVVLLWKTASVFPAPSLCNRGLQA